MAFTEDLSVFLDPDDFADTAVWSVGSAPVNGIFDAEYRDPLGLVETTGPVFLAAMSTMPGVAHGQSLTVGGTTYRIARVMRNHGGPGMALLKLEKP